MQSGLVVGVDRRQGVVEQVVARVQELEVERVVQRQRARVPPVPVEPVLLQGAARSADLEQVRPVEQGGFGCRVPRLAGDQGRLTADAGVTEMRDGLVAQVGGAQRVLDSSVEYAKNRVQFGRPIGSFQAIKHKCADMLLDVESAKSAAYYAAWAAQERNDELPIAASLAKSFCSEAYFHCAAENIQIHGGIGFTWEHPAHLYFKRAKSSELFLGDPAYHRELLAQRLGV